MAQSPPRLPVVADCTRRHLRSDEDVSRGVPRIVVTIERQPTHWPQTRVITSEAFWPPKPKLLEIAVSSGISRDVLGT